MSEFFNLNSFQLLTAGLYSGDKVAIRINYMIQAFSFFKLGFRVRIEGELDGQRSVIADSDLGSFCYQDNQEMIFTGNMPSGKPLLGKLTFKGTLISLIPMGYVTFAERSIAIANLDDVVPPTPPPNGDPPAVCTEGQEKCVGYDKHVCQNGEWKLKEYDSVECGFLPPQICREGERKCVGTTLLICQYNEWKIEKQNATECGYVPPTPPNGDEPPIPPVEDWFTRNKTTIIVVSAIVLVLALIIIVKKQKIGIRSPIKGFQRPITRGGK